MHQDVKVRVRIKKKPTRTNEQEEELLQELIELIKKRNLEEAIIRRIRSPKNRQDIKVVNSDGFKRHHLEKENSCDGNSRKQLDQWDLQEKYTYRPNERGRKRKTEYNKIVEADTDILSLPNLLTN